uniref:Ig-like domain-containing protein n=1 Tax=Chromera velia CCMP2878 TaxID=1169474 RepID=A0A0G4IBS8_9ALVE|eukprot:Cvel_12908.t1-p1 / transcript=Cvel_12908.t1 / gene=Cvel_12908 / organism=Chromera_velia_CCMP2878 / gene_product=hypothetical protein / transcript_product=hypothetical protein / location=Cvel_scaffold862:57298-58485(+) / protein_length=396 / sequence_SO=supercontig / SO=protein_coding / is_pseudo=false
MAALSQSSSFHAPEGFSASAVGQMNAETLRALIENGTLHPDAWFEMPLEKEWDLQWVRQGEGVGRSYKYWKPFLIVLIEAHNFEGALLLLEAGARTDVCEWAEEPESPIPWSPGYRAQPHFYRPGKTPLHSLIFTFCSPDSSPSDESSQIPRSCDFSNEWGVTIASESKTNCLGWTCSIPFASVSGEDMCSLSLACYILAPKAVAEQLSVREAGLSPAEGGRLIGLATEKLQWKAIIGVESEWNTDIEQRARIERRYIGVLEALADWGADLSNGLPWPFSSGTPLNHACFFDAERVVEFLLERGVSPNRSTHEPFIIGFDRKRWPIAKRLLRGGADPNELQGFWGESAVEKYLRDADLQSPQLRIEILEELAKAGANFEALICEDKHTPLSLAIEW